MICITVYAGPSKTRDDERDASTSSHYVSESDVSEKLRHIGLEWKTADYMTSRQVVITLDRMPDCSGTEVREKVRAAAIALEATGLL